MVVWSFLTWVPDIQNLIVGVLASIFVTFLTGDIFIQDTKNITHHARYFYFIFHYIPLFVWEVIKANIDVAYRVMHPKLPISPGIVRVETKLKTDIALTFLTNSITLTPGTLSVDVNKKDSCLYVHWIYVRAQDAEAATKAVVERFENVLQKVFE